MIKEMTKLTLTQAPTKLKAKYDIVYYIAHTGFTIDSFDRYPEWLKGWISENHFKLDNRRLALLRKDANIVNYDFALGDCVIFFNESKEILCGMQAIVKLIEMQMLKPTNIEDNVC